MSNEKSNVPYVFISYSHADIEAAARLAARLSKAKIRHFRDKEGIKWGESIPKKVHDALQQATHLIVLISPGSEKSQWVAYEMGYGRGREATIIPFLLHPSMTVPGFIADLRYVVAGTPDEEAFIRSLARKGRSRRSTQKKASLALAARIRDFRKLMISRSPAHREKAIAAAANIGSAALPVIHDLLGHSHLDVAISAYKAVGEIHDVSSVPFLVAGLYPRRSSTRAQFPTAETAASVLKGYPEEVRLDALDSINEAVRPVDIQTVMSGLPPKRVYPLVLQLFVAGLFHEDWDGLGGLSLLLRVDEQNTWPIVETQLASGRALYSSTAFRKVYPFASPEHKKSLIEHFMGNPARLSGFELPEIYDRIIQGRFDGTWRIEQLQRLEKVAGIVYRRASERKELTDKIRRYIGGNQGKSEAGEDHD